MCGICGFVSKKSEKMETLVKMNNTLAHRGPDDHGEEIYSIFGSWNLGLAQRRLSIIDLSDKGHQPMHSVNKRISVVFNGEIYNFRELREEIRDYPFYTDCDTEIIIAAYMKWGIRFVDRLNGMYAIALFDREINSLYLIRDRIGKKPLYYYIDEDRNLVFASELKAILESSLFTQELNQQAIALYMFRRYFQPPDTVYKNVYQLEPGTLLKFQDGMIEKLKYWGIAEKYNKLRNNQIADYGQARYELKELLKKAVSYRMISDVPIGAFLSGGIDSTTVCALAQEQCSQPLKTFCIGFDDKQRNEAEYAKKVAEYLGTEHEEMYLGEKEMFDLLDTVPTYFDEPFADTSQIPTMLVSALAKKKVTVALAGDGGDEFFGGYNIYTTMAKAQKKATIGKLIYAVRKIPGIGDLDGWRKMPLEYRIASEDLDKNARTQTGVNTYLKVLYSILEQPADNFYFPYEADYREERYDMRRMLLDMDTFLPNDILTKVDRASMKYALECRCPILDREVMEYSFKLPIEFKIYKGNKKRILKDIVYDYVPRELVDRPKIGFSMPLNKWLMGPLKEKVKDWANADYLKKQGIFKPKLTEQFISDYLEHGDGGKGGKNYSQIIWPFYMFQEWYERYIGTVY